MIGSMRTKRVVGLLLVLTAATSAGVHGQSPAAAHPLVGVWVVDTNTADATDPPARVVLGADGSLIQVLNGEVAIGAWEPTDDRSGALTVTAPVTTDDGSFGGASTIRADLEATDDGAGWTATFTVEYLDAAGVSSGQLGPVTASATRVVIEPMGPAASPAS